MASKSLKYEIFGKDRTASKTMDTVAAKAGRVAKRIAAAALAIAAAITAVVVRFGIESVKAAAEAETQQNKLTAAWEKFPKTANLSLVALRAFNSELAKKTRYDDDAIASGQAVLAQFKLTGKQIQKLTPLLLDYAARTGKDLPTAAQDLGKALLGQGRSLKAIGVNFKDTGTLAGNLDAIMAALSTQVGGFAEKEGETTAGKLEILKNRFGEVQEAIGFALMPALSDLIDFTNETVLPGLENFSGWFTETGMPAIRDAIGWITQYKDILGPAAAALGVLTAAQWALNVAMDANPVGVIILAVGALIALVTALATDFGGLRTTILSITGPIVKGFYGIMAAVMKSVQGAVNSVIGGINAILGPINAVRQLLGMGTISVPYATFGNAAQQIYATYTTGLNLAIAGGGPSTKVSSPMGHNAGAFAEGGIVPARPGGWWAQVGEGGQDEAIIPLDRLGSMGGRGDVYNINVPGYVGSDDAGLKKLARYVAEAKKRGSLPGSAFA